MNYNHVPGVVSPTRTSVFKNFLAFIISRPDTENVTDGQFTNTDH